METQAKREAGCTNSPFDSMKGLKGFSDDLQLKTEPLLLGKNVLNYIFYSLIKEDKEGLEWSPSLLVLWTLCSEEWRNEVGPGGMTGWEARKRGALGSGLQQ